MSELTGDFGGDRATFGNLTGKPRRDTLLGSGVDPFEIDVTGDVCQLSILVEEDCFFAINTTATLAAADIVANDCGKIPANSLFHFGFAGESTRKFYIRAVGASPSTKISYWKHTEA